MPLRKIVHWAMMTMSRPCIYITSCKWEMQIFQERGYKRAHVRKTETMDYTIRKTFSKCVNDTMSEKGITQANLERLSLLSRTTVSRICRNCNDKGSTYQPLLPVVCAVSIGLALNRIEAKNLLFSAFPELELLGEFLDRQLKIDEVNDILYDKGLTLWGTAESEKY